VALAQEQVARLEALTEGLLSLSSLEAEKQVATPVPIALDALVQEIAELYASQAEQAGLALDLHVAERPLLVVADAAQVRDALSNLLDNACKFTPQGGAVSVSLEREQGWAVLRVQDTGIGIPPEDLPQLFERFHRGRNATAYPGSGLGLAIVRAIAERSGGAVEVETVEEGARFVLRLPLQRNGAG
jgi:signal transduction histidine kinase